MPSKSIHSFDYDSKRRVLSIRFRTSGRRYDYAGVPPEVVEGLRRAKSKGRYFNAHIRDKYPAEWQAWERTLRPAVFPADRNDLQASNTMPTRADQEGQPGRK